MADRDFAQLQATVKPDTPGPDGASRLRSTLLVLGILSVVIMAFVGGYWLGSQQGHDSIQAAARARLQAQLQAQQKELQALRQQAKKAAQAKGTTDVSPTTEVGDLTFYTDLPKQPVKPQPLSQPVTSPGKPATPPSSAPSPASAATGSDKMVASIIQREMDRKPTVSPMAKGTAYYVQVASLPNAKDAAGIQKKLQGAGFASRVRRADIPGRGIWYRLQVGPYPSRIDADAARVVLGNKLRLKGIVIRDSN